MCSFLKLLIPKHRRQSFVTNEKEEKAIAAIKKEPIQVDQFLLKLQQKKLDKYLNFEVRAIVRNQEEHPSTIANLPENKPRNVCQDVISYDHSLLSLHDRPPGDRSAYINASYIEGFNGDEQYIATQGPRGKTVAAFWHMVWQENVHVIVMTTGLFENSVQQCDKYWGDILSVQKYVRQGDIHIHHKDTLTLAKLLIRTFQISKDGCEEVRVVKHFEMSGFTDVDTDPGFLLDVHRRITRIRLTVPGPMLVHCRCGGGKSATFIAIDYCLKQLDAEKCVDIYSAVLHLRKFRQNMVRSLSQYRLIYDTLAMYVQVWNTVVPVSQLPAFAHRLMLKDPHTNVLPIDKEFQFLHKIVPKITTGDCASGHRDENRNKSRDIMILPPERARPYLQTIETNDDMGTDFVNAVLIDGYHYENRFIATQMPLPSTVNDIWRLLFDFKVNTLVLLHEDKCTRNVPCFWPKVLDEEVKYGPIGVKYLGCQKYPHIIIRAFSIRKLPNNRYNEFFDGSKASQDSKVLPLLDLFTKDRTKESFIVKMFQYTSWTDQERIPTSTKSFLYMMGCADEWQKRNKSGHPICVMSKDGYSKIGLYCTLNICCDQLHCEKEVDIFNAVRTVKKNRPQLIPTLEEYIYCFSYMSLVVHLMQEDSPKIAVTSPTVVEGEVQQGYELVTGFENILCAKSPKQTKQATSLMKTLPSRTKLSAFNSNYPSDSLSSSSESIERPGLKRANTLVDVERVTSNHRNSSSRTTAVVKENGHLLENGPKPKHSLLDAEIHAPATTGRIHSLEMDMFAHYNDTKPAELPRPERTAMRRPPLLRQSAQEMKHVNKGKTPSTMNILSKFGVHTPMSSETTDSLDNFNLESPTQRTGVDFNTSFF